MVYHGIVKEGGVIELDEGARLAEGTRVKIEPVPSDERSVDGGGNGLFQMSKWAVDTGITDLATNIDHYLYGHPKVDPDG